MGSVGVPELIVIFIIALIVFGPRKLPELGRTIGKALAEFRKHSAELRMAVDQEMRELERHTQELEAKAREAVEPPAAPGVPPESPVSPAAIDPYQGVPPQPTPAALSSEEPNTGEKPTDGHSKPA